MKGAKAIVIICLVFCFAGQLFAEKIRLKDGGVVRGKVVSENASEIVIANEYGNITIEKKNIAKRIREKSDIPSFKNSSYSFKKRSWPKYAVLGTAMVGVGTTAFLADAGYALLSAGGFTLVAGGFAALDYFRYGRVPKRIRRRFGYSPSPLYMPAMPLATTNSEWQQFHQQGQSRFNLAYTARFN